MFELQKGRKTCSPESNMRSEVNFQIAPDIFLEHVAKIHYRTCSSGDIQHGLLSSHVVVYGVPPGAMFLTDMTHWCETH